MPKSLIARSYLKAKHDEPRDPRSRRGCSHAARGAALARRIAIDAEDRLEVSREIPAALRLLEATSPVPAAQPEPVQ